MNVQDIPGYYLITNNKVVLNKERMIKINQKPFKRPKNYKEYDHSPTTIFIYGDETPEELVEKILKVEGKHRNGVGLVIFSVFNFQNDMSYNQMNPCSTLVECFTLLKNKDVDTFNSFKKGEILDRLGLKPKWYEFWK